MGPRPRQHHGVLVCVLGVLGLLACPLLGVPAVALGIRDLREMRQGRMDSGGRALTLCGVIIGALPIVATIIFLTIALVLGTFA